MKRDDHSQNGEEAIPAPTAGDRASSGVSSSRVFPLIYWFLIVIYLAVALTADFDNDEGAFIHIAERISDGETVNISLTPLSYHLLALCYKLFGVSVLTGRILLLFCDLCSLALIFLLARRILSASSAYVVATLSALLAYGNFIYLQSYYNWLAVFFAVLTLTTVARSDAISHARWSIATGIMILLTIITKVNYGIFVYCASVFFWATKGIALPHTAETQPKRKIAANLLFLHTGLLIPLLFAGLMVPDLFAHYVDSALDIRAYVSFTLEEGSVAVDPFTFTVNLPNSNLAQIILHLLPHLVAIVIISAMIIFRRYRHRIRHPSETYLLLLFSFFSFFVVFPRVDFSHTLLTLPFVIPLSAVMLRHWERQAAVEATIRKWPSLIANALPASLMLFVFVAQVWRHSELYGSVDGVYTGIRMHHEKARQINTIRDVILRHSTKDDYLLALPGDARLYPICRRKNPTPQIVFGEHQSTQDRLYTLYLSRNSPRIVSYNEEYPRWIDIEMHKTLYPRLWQYILANYREVEAAPGYRVFVRNTAPRKDKNDQRSRRR